MFVKETISIITKKKEINYAITYLRQCTETSSWHDVLSKADLLICLR